MITFTGQKNLIVVSVIHLLLNFCQENLFVKSLCCKKEIEAFSCLVLYYVISTHTILKEMLHIPSQYDVYFQYDTWACFFLQQCHLLNKNYCDILRDIWNCLQYFRIFIYSVISCGTMVGRQ